MPQIVPVFAAIGSAITAAAPYVAVAGSIVGLASTAYTMLNPPKQQQQAPRIFTPTAIPMPVFQGTGQTLGGAQMPTIPQMEQQPLMPTASEGIVAVDANQTKRMGQVRSAFFTGEVPYKQQTTGAVESTNINNEDKNAIDQVLGS